MARMLMGLTGVVCWITVASSVSAAELPITLNAPVTLIAENVPVDVMFRVTEAMTGVKIQIDPDVLQAWGLWIPERLSMGIEKLEARRLIAWLVHFSNAKATIHDGAVRVLSADSETEGDPVFDCFKEMDGAWREALARSISSTNNNMISITLDDVAVEDALKMLSRIGFDVLFDPVLLRNDAIMTTKWTGSLEDVPFTNFLDSVARKAGFIWRLQGGVVFVTTDGVSRAQSPPAASDEMSLRLNGAAIDNVAFLKGVSLTDLSLAGTKVTDLSPLKGMPLRQLKLSDTQVTDLSPFRGMTMDGLVLSRTPLTNGNLSPLKTMTVDRLTLDQTKITDLVSLQGIRVWSLSIEGTEVNDLTPLREMPIERLYIEGTRVRDLSPLGTMKLRHIRFSLDRIKTGIEVLREMKSLEWINGLSPSEFWRKYDAGEFKDRTPEPAPENSQSVAPQP